MCVSQVVNNMNADDPDKPLKVPLFIDNRSAKLMSESYKDNKATRHILRRMHFAKWAREQDFTEWFYCANELMIADATSKLPKLCNTWELMLSVTQTAVEL